jgi:quercetin dioxygenase-like cupin family protein
MSFITLDALEQREPFPGFKGRFVHSGNMTVAHWRVEKGSAAPEHSHPHEQIALVTQGAFELMVEGEAQVLTPGVVAVIPPNAVHSGTALTACQVIDVFHPVREDLR